RTRARSRRRRSRTSRARPAPRRCGARRSRPATSTPVRAARGSRSSPARRSARSRRRGSWRASSARRRGRGRAAARAPRPGARGARFAIFPGSPLSKKPPAWIMAGELVETSRLWARDVARIQPEWAEDLAGDLARRTYSEPHWSTKRGAAIATEKVLLYGAPIVADRKVLYAKVDPEAAREMFVRHALVQGEWTTHHRFFHENRRLLE